MDFKVATLGEIQSIPFGSCEIKWKTANQYFKSIVSVEHLRQICLNFHKDINLEQELKLKDQEFLGEASCVLYEWLIKAQKFCKKVEFDVMHLDYRACTRSHKND